MCIFTHLCMYLHLFVYEITLYGLRSCRFRNSGVRIATSSEVGFHPASHSFGLSCRFCPGANFQPLLKRFFIFVFWLLDVLVPISYNFLFVGLSF